MIDVVKTTANVTFQRKDRLVLRLRRQVYGMNDVCYCVFLRPVRPEPIAVWIKPCFTDRLNDDTDTLLDDTV